MNYFLIWVCLALVAWPSAFAMYYTGSIEVFKPPAPLRTDAYFGYSITYDQFNKNLVISAPRANEYGEVYDCHINNRTCIAIPRTIVENRPKNYKHDYWFGATVKSGADYVLMCAPRYTEHVEHFNSYETLGRCYSHKKGVLYEKKVIDWNKRIQDTRSTMEATMDSFGWSIDIASNDVILVGGPGMFHGRVMIYPQSNMQPQFIKKTTHTPEFNFGYSVASGMFLNKALSYAVGSTYSYGEVSFYKGESFQRKLSKPEDTKTVVGSMFGAVLCAARLVGKRTDLLVGAPTYATKNTYNLGAVYVYLALEHFINPQFKRMIVGQSSGAMFGSAIVSVGDLNGDLRHEIAIGAPFENNGRGVVYLYSGADLISELTEKTLKWLQKIEPAATYGESFGMSLTPLLDYDSNGCNELAIGAPYKDTVVLLRCMASVIVETSAKFPNLQGRTKSGKTDFEFQVCLSVKYPTLPTKVIALIRTSVEMNHDDAKLTDTKGTGRFTFDTSLADKKTEYCKNVPFNLPKNGKYETEISYTIKSELLNDPKTLPGFDSSRVVLSDRSVLTLQDSLWAAECANQTCVPNLGLKYHVSCLDHIPYIIGSSNVETIKISVRNTGEVAYDSCVRVHIVGAIVLKPGGCEYQPSTDGDRLKCEPSKPLGQNDEWVTGAIELEMTRLTNLQQMINITIHLHNRCNDAVNETTLISIPLEADPSGITAKGETDIGAIVNITKDDMEYNGKTMQHVYTIVNNGPTNWRDLTIYVTLQKEPYIKYGIANLYRYYYSILDSQTDCTLISQNEKTMAYICNIESLMTKLEEYKIYIPMIIVPGTLDGLLDKDKNVTITSSAKLQLKTVGGIDKIESITTIITLQDAAVPIETIIIAVVVGLCILIIIALILYRVGFLRRKRREELQKLRKSVKRQTILRRSTMPSQGRPSASGPPEDRRQILEEEEECDPKPTFKRTTE